MYISECIQFQRQHIKLPRFPFIIARNSIHDSRIRRWSHYSDNISYQRWCVHRSLLPVVAGIQSETVPYITLIGRERKKNIVGTNERSPIYSFFDFSRCFFWPATMETFTPIGSYILQLRKYLIRKTFRWDLFRRFCSRLPLARFIFFYLFGTLSSMFGYKKERHHKVY